MAQIKAISGSSLNPTLRTICESLQADKEPSLSYRVGGTDLLWVRKQKKLFYGDEGKSISCESIEAGTKQLGLA